MSSKNKAVIFAKPLNNIDKLSTIFQIDNILHTDCQLDVLKLNLHILPLEKLTQTHAQTCTLQELILIDVN